MYKRYTAVVLGCGKIGATFEIDAGLVKPASHAAAIIANPRTELVAIVDIDPEALKRAGDYYGVETYDDAKTCIEKCKPDIVVIATAPSLHEEQLSLAIQLGTRAIVCEKPLSDNLDSANRMFQKASVSDAIVIVNYQRRYFPLFREARERIRSGELGRIQQAVALYANGLLNNGGHSIDALRFLIGSEVGWVIAVENRLNINAPFGSNIDGLIGFENGAVATLQSLDNESYSVNDFQIFGTKGALIIRNFGYHFDWILPRKGVTFNGVNELDWESAVTSIDRRSMVADSIAYAVDCLDDNEASQSSLKDGYETMRVLDALILSAKEGGKRISL